MKKKLRKRPAKPAANKDPNLDMRGQLITMGAVIQQDCLIGQVEVIVDGCIICRGLNDEAEAHFCANASDSVLLASMKTEA